MALTRVKTKGNIEMSEGINLNEFLDFTQQELNQARLLNTHEFLQGSKMNGIWETEIAARERLQKTVVELIASAPKKKDTPSYTTHAMALHLKGITINKKGIGVNDEIDYAKKFGLPSRGALYNRLNDIINEKIANPADFHELANQIIKEHKL